MSDDRFSFLWREKIFVVKKVNLNTPEFVDRELFHQLYCVWLPKMATRKQSSRHFENFTISRALTPTWHWPEQQDQPFENKSLRQFRDGSSSAHPHQLKSPLLASAKMFQMKTFLSFAAFRKKLLMKIVSVDFPSVGPYDQNYEYKKETSVQFYIPDCDNKGGQSC